MAVHCPMKHVNRMSHSELAEHGAWRFPQGEHVSQTAVALSLSRQISEPRQPPEEPIDVQVGAHNGGTWS